jgi:anti-sigma-K factor RskA
MDCNERIVDLLPDYHLGHLPLEEADEVRRHLEEHAACREELEEISRVLDLMPLSVPAAAPPPSLKQRTLARALGEGTGEESVGTTAAPTPIRAERAQEPPHRGRRENRWAMLPAALAAAVFVVAFAAFAWAYLDLRNDNQQLQAEVQELREEVDAGGGGGELVVVAVEGTGRAPEARGTAIVEPESGSLALDVYNLPAPPEGHSYRAWLVDPSGQDASLGPMEINDRGDGRMTGGVTQPVTSFESVQVTVEPEGAEERNGPVYLEARL